MDAVERMVCLRMPAILVIVLVVLSFDAVAAVETEKVGIASPQVESEVGNIEVLRKRAIRNAMDLALLEVSGTTVSSEQADSMRSSDKLRARDGIGSTETKQESSFKDASLTRTEGHVRLLEIVKEWQEGDRYHVRVRLEVLDRSEMAEKLGAGHFWERVGKPGIVLTIRDTVNNVETGEPDPYTLRFVRDVLAKNGLEALGNATPSSRYYIDMTQEVSIGVVKSFGTYAARCNLSFGIRDERTGRVLVENRAAHGPQAGFSMQSAKTDCLREIAPRISEKLVRSLARIFNDQWNQGDEFLVSVADLPRAYLTEATDALGRGFRVTGQNVDSYTGGTLTVTVRFKGKQSDLARAVVVAFEDIGQQVVPDRVELSQISFRWLGYLEK